MHAKRKKRMRSEVGANGDKFHIAYRLNVSLGSNESVSDSQHNIFHANHLTY